MKSTKYLRKWLQALPNSIKYAKAFYSCAIILCVWVVASQNAFAQNVKLCYKSVGTWAIGGAERTFADDKLLSTANFGLTGTSPYSFTLYDFGTSAVTYTALIAQGCQIFDAGLAGNTDAASSTNTTSYTTSEKADLAIWTAEPNHIIIGFQGFAAYWGGSGFVASGSGNNNPNGYTSIGDKLFGGPFGTVTTFNQAGGYQGTFTSIPSTACVVTQDATNDPTGVIDQNIGDLFLADCGLVAEAAGLTSAATITSNTDKFYANMMHNLAKVVSLGIENANLCSFIDCVPGSAPILTASSISGSCDPANLSTLFTGTVPTGKILTWHSGTPATDANYIGNATTITQSSTVYAAFRDIDGGCYSPTVPVTVTVSSPDLAVTVSSVSPAVAQGENQTYSVTVTNNGAIAAPNATVRVPVPQDRTLVLAQPSVGSYNSTTGVWTVGNLANGASATLVMTIKVN